MTKVKCGIMPDDAAYDCFCIHRDDAGYCTKYEIELSGSIENHLECIQYEQGEPSRSKDQSFTFEVRK